MRSALYPLLLACAVALIACDDETSSFGLDAAASDAASTSDGAIGADGLLLDSLEDDSRREDGAKHDGAPTDGGAPDATVDSRAPDATGDSRVDTRWPDATVDSRVDTRAPDATVDSRVDTRAPDATVDSRVDTRAPDATVDTLGPPPGLSTPCQNGPGWTLFRFHYDSGSTSARVDVWDASCSYSFAPNSACNVRTVYPGFGDVGTTSQGYPILTTSEYLRVRFSVAGLSFDRAAVYVRARSYATSSSTYYRVWSPLYGELEGGPVDNDWVYDWYGLDWSDLLSPLDKPSLTAIQIYASRGSGKLAVRAVELCVQ